MCTAAGAPRCKAEVKYMMTMKWQYEVYGKTPSLPRQETATGEVANALPQ
jgi:hypothetical protein